MDPNTTSGFSADSTASLKSIPRTVLQWLLEEAYAYPVRFFFAITTLSLTYTVIHSISVRFRHLNQYPGPTWAPYTRLWLCKTMASADGANKWVAINKQFGSLARIGPNHLLTDDPELTKRVLGARSPYVRGPSYNSAKIDLHIRNVVSERDPAKHNRLRHQLSAGYAGKDVENFEAAVSERIEDFVNRMDKNWISKPGDTKILDIATKIQYLAMDTMSHLCFGQPIGFVETDSDVSNFLQGAQRIVSIAQHLSIIPEITTLTDCIQSLPWLGKMLTVSAGDKTGFGMILGIARKIVNERFESKEPGEVKRDILGSFIRHGLSQKPAELEIIITLFAGADGIATSARAILLFIISNDRVRTRLQNEIDEAISRGKISSPIQEEEARKLPYLQACIKEGLRRFPPLAQLRERSAPPEGDTYNGQHIPGGTLICLNTWGSQLNPVFGEDPEVFRPERWLIDDEERLNEMNHVQDLVFGYGDTKCLGMPTASIAMNKILVEVSTGKTRRGYVDIVLRANNGLVSQLLRRFDISVVNPTRPWTSLCYGAFFQKDFNVTVTRRA
ncbi:hypothetical protein FQN54_003072 [Arachnomyces sp. PD_36]|nr:hypothetical protein FQN54_003072 [Arachnomyces sp. PD_36]